jgi:hypothetical protein
VNGFTDEQWREIMATPLPRYTGAQLGTIAAAYRWRVPGLSKSRARAAVLGFQRARSHPEAMRALLDATELAHRRLRRRGGVHKDGWWFLTALFSGGGMRGGS